MGTNRPVVGPGPVPYLADNNKFFLIPLSGLSFDDKGASTPHPGRRPRPRRRRRPSSRRCSPTSPRAESAPRQVPSATLSFKFEAAAAGAGGNGTAVTIAKVKPDAASPPDPTKTEFELTVAETATFELSYDRTPRTRSTRYSAAARPRRPRW